MAGSDDGVFESFRTSPIYTQVLEHVSFEDGQRYLDVILERGQFSGSDFDRFRENDLYGGAVVFEYEKVGTFSPSTLRYIKVLSDLLLEFGDLSGKKICEIGVGYGGQARIILAHCKVASYQLVDLDSVMMLVRKYLGCFDIESRLIFGLENELENAGKNFGNEGNENNESDLIISNYAFSELRQNVQDFYIDKLIKVAKHGYITYNNIAPDGFNYSLSQYPATFDRDIKIKKEEPQTHTKNAILVF